MKILRLPTTLWQTARYNRDWPRYIWTGLVPPADDAPLTFRLRNGQVLVTHGSTRWVLNEIYVHRVYDVPGVDLAACRQIFDVGANVGVFALYASAQAHNASIACFEPSSANFSVLARNLAMNHSNARPYRLAISTTCEPRKLSLSGSSVEYSLSSRSDTFEMVDCVDLESAFRLTGCSTCDFMKIDVEGEELPILTTAPIELLRRIHALAVEWHHSVEQLEPVRTRLNKIGFETFLQTEGRELMLKARQR